MEKSMGEIFLKSKGDYIEGAFVKSDGSKAQQHTVFSPADLTDTVFEYFSDPNHIEAACESAAKAYPAWSALSQESRNVHLERLAYVYREKEKEMAILISRETGKPLWESQTEAEALSQKVDITLKESLPLVQNTSLVSVREGVQGKIAYRSKGVFLVLGPFNFPVHLPNGHIIAALAAGNTVIFKPSDKAPASAEKLAECFHLADFPKGVFNLIQGGAEIAQSLVRDSRTDGILFTGSYAVGKKIQEGVLDQPQKILALEMGGKNSALVWKDADVETALYEILKGAYLTCGQRCSATSRLILHEEIKDVFLKKFVQLSRRIKIGYWKDNPFMGPLIDEGAVGRFMKVKEEAQEARIHLSGERLDRLDGYYVSPAVVEPKAYDSHSFYQNEELFMPFVTVYGVLREEEALHLINQSSYGLCLSVFSRGEEFVKRIFQKAKVGVFHWNLSTNGASSRLPFGGLGKSGNDRPAGLFSVYACTTPVAWMQKEDQAASKILFNKDFLYDEENESVN